MPDNEIPNIIVSRLPRYLQAIRRMFLEGIQTTSSQELAKHLGMSAAQYRKDLSQFGEFGKQGTGYSVQYLINQLQNILKVDRIWDMVLVGAGDLGHAIARYRGFKDCGFRIVFVFDNDPKKIKTKIDQFIVQDSRDLVNVIRQTDIKIAMITVPAIEAQSVTNMLVEAGIRAILNYAPTVLQVPENVYVQYIDPVIYLQRMTYYLE